MSSNGIRDQVAIVGMGCTSFGENWDSSPPDMLLDAATQAHKSAGIEPDEVDAYWLGTLSSGSSGLLQPESLSFSTPMAMTKSYAPQATA